MKSLLILALTFFLMNKVSKAQVTDSTRTVMISPQKKTVSTILAGAVFAPKLHYFGRTDSLRSTAILPTLLIQFDSTGLYASATSVLLNNKIQSFKYAGTIAEAGFRFGKQKGFSGNIYGNKFFYNTTQLPQSALKEQAGINLNYLNNTINVTTAGSAAFSNSRTDFFTSAGLNKNFKWQKGKSIFIITPTAVLNAGSQNFTSAYYKQNTVAGIPINNTLITESSRRFNIISYDFSTPFIWAYKNVFIIATPTYVIPESVIRIDGFPQLSENAQNLFFINLTALYSIKIKKNR